VVAGHFVGSELLKEWNDSIFRRFQNTFFYTSGDDLQADLACASPPPEPPVPRHAPRPRSMLLPFIVPTSLDVRLRWMVDPTFSV